MTTEATTAAKSLITNEELLKHWQSHRGLSRKILAQFPEKDLFEFSIGSMRPYSELAGEMIGLASAGMNGFVTGQWTTTPELDHFDQSVHLATKAALLEAWDDVTEQIEELWPQIQEEHFHDVVKAFGMYENSVINTILYFIDNEIHHRGQGYVYLRALGIEPNPFWDR
ncbi:MAG: damage-inducible protein DinB [Mucilaginibacter sp.]|nr:damage-inducible protein DinB [Mucilaginibacter sp.]